MEATRHIAALLLISLSAATLPAETMKLKTRTQVLTASSKGRHMPMEREVQWDTKKTAIIICDMWDKHWCPNSEARVGEMAGPMNTLIEQARKRGVFIIHAPSSVVDFYKDTPQRKRAQSASFAKTPIALSTAQRWGTAWCWPDPQREPTLPIDDSDMGCDCKEKYEPGAVWKRQIKTLRIDPADAITDNAQETWNLLHARGIDNVILMGVHLNMCVLGRPFGIRQMVKLGKNVVLVRDFTDCMYNPRMRPYVSHFAGNRLMVEYVEKYWCPTITSTTLTGKPEFRFKSDK
jgi:nicotinamidase-related amidase